MSEYVSSSTDLNIAEIEVTQVDHRELPGRIACTAQHSNPQLAMVIVWLDCIWSVLETLRWTCSSDTVILMSFARSVQEESNDAGYGAVFSETRTKPKKATAKAALNMILSCGGIAVIDSSKRTKVHST